jgi:hypothetical protein
MNMVTKSSKSNKNLSSKQKFLKEVKSEKYAQVNKKSIVYSRLSEQAQPHSQNQSAVIFYGIK